MTNQSQYTIKMLVAAIIISTSSVWVKTAAVAPSVSGFYRMFIGGTVLLAICFIQRLRLWHNTKHLLWLFLAGFFFACDLFFWHRSIFFVGPGLATVLGNFQVFFMALAGYLFYREIIRLTFFIGLISTMTGLFLMVGINWSDLTGDYQLGVIYGILTAVAYTGFMLSLRHVQTDESGLSAIANLGITSIFTALILFAELTIEGLDIVLPNTQAWVSLLILGVFCQVIGWLLITQSMPKLSTSIVGVLLLLQPALSMLWDVLFFYRPMSKMDIIGLGMVLFGVYLATVKKRAKKSHL
ncbi:MAG TPA: DMT family transporter [Gammaproteobacteria bacterium]|nr:DMT family transporter [Xanthomonadales bacterium]HOP21572.1 DMT family transporter [Gammaproteobacteria bacterium]HPQ86171.1 DMT family transporter [Gammaproteobacteria bacterium]